MASSPILLSVVALLSLGAAETRTSGGPSVELTTLAEQAIGEFAPSSDTQNTAWNIQWSDAHREGAVGQSPSEIGSLKQRSITLYRDMEEGSPKALTETTMRRALAYSVWFLLDEEHGWSEKYAWKSINGWRDALESYNIPWAHAANQNKPLYLLHEEVSSPQHDLASFMSWYLTVPESPLTDSPLCQTLSQVRFAQNLMRQVMPTYPVRLADPGQSCRRYSNWAQLDAIESIELNFATPGTKSATSSFGHLYLRIIYRSALGYHALGHSRVITFWAQTDPRDEGSLFYTLGGVFGAYLASIHVEPFESTYRTYVVQEERDILRWALNLDTAGKHRLMERAWTSQEGAAYAYFFLQQNCATLLLDLINSTLPSDQVKPNTGILGRSPAQGLDALADTTLEDGRPFLQFIPDRILSMRSAAIKSNKALKDIRNTLEDLVEEPVADLLEEVRSGNSEVRAQAYQSMEAVFAPIKDTHADLLHSYFFHRGLIESHINSQENLIKTEKLQQKRFAQLTEFERNLPTEVRAHLKTHSLSLPPNEALLLQRKVDSFLQGLSSELSAEQYQAYDSILEFVGAPDAPTKLANAIRCLALLRALSHPEKAGNNNKPLFRALFFPSYGLPLTEQPYLVDYLAAFTERYSTVVSQPLLTLQASKAALLGNAKLRSDSRPAPKDFVLETDVATELKEYGRAYSHSGIDRFGIDLGGYQQSTGQQPKPLVGIRGAFYHEGLGDASRHGLRGRRELTVFANESWWTWTHNRPSLAQYELRLIGYRDMLREDLEEGSSILGWEFYSDIDVDVFPGLNRRNLVGIGGIAKLLGSDDLSHHLLATTGINVEFRHHDDQEVGLGLPLGLEGRVALLPLTRAFDSITWQASITPFWGISSKKPTLIWSAKLEALYALSDGIGRIIDLPEGISARIAIHAAGGDLLAAHLPPNIRASMGLEFH